MAEKRRRTIGVIIDWAEIQYQLKMVQGVEDVAMEADVNLYCFAGGALVEQSSQMDGERPMNYIYDLISSENIDGLIILSDTIGHRVDASRVRQFCRSFFPIPVISMERDLDGFPSIVHDHKGVEELVTHLIEDHGYRKFAYISGPVQLYTSIQRFQAFSRTLGKHGVSFDDRYYIQGHYLEESGTQAVKTLLDEFHADVDVIVAANDSMAFGAIEELRRRNISVPDDIAVVGFDNLDLCLISSPPLTTVSHFVYEQGRKAAQLLLERIEGKPIPDITVQPTKLVIRQSCGCLSTGMATVHSAESNRRLKDFTTGFPERKPEIIQGLLEAVRTRVTFLNSSEVAGLMDRIATSFYGAVTRAEEMEFFQQWNRLLYAGILETNDASLMEFLVSVTRNVLNSYVSDIEGLKKAEDLWHQVRIMIAEKALIDEKNKGRKYSDGSRALITLREDLLSMFSEADIMDDLALRLPAVGIESCFLSLFTKTGASLSESSRLLLAFDRDKRLPIGPEGVKFPTKDIIPRKVFEVQERFSYFVTHLNLSNTQFGYVLFSMEIEDKREFEALRRIICSSLQGAHLMQKVQIQTSSLRSQKLKLSRTLNDLRTAMGGFIQTIARTVETRDPYTAGHQRRVADLARVIGLELGLDNDEVEGIRMAGILHDLGKIYVPSEILNKPGKLRDLEFDLIKIHCEVAYDILKPIKFPWPIAQIILQHHEHMDGTGYPNGLKGDEICLAARIIHVADVVEAMASHRPYRPAMGIQRALNEIAKYKGIRYDARIVDVCIHLFQNKGFTFSDVSSYDFTHLLRQD
ncbi:MAG: substrate-binding domain-containing protein [Spirochaetales bacterium]|nr:substrate-binding domain-containing protein [Spirochaetales bacterium]